MIHCLNPYALYSIYYNCQIIAASGLHSRCSPEVFLKRGVLWHLPDVFPIFIWGIQRHRTKSPTENNSSCIDVCALHILVCRKSMQCTGNSLKSLGWIIVFSSLINKTFCWKTGNQQNAIILQACKSDTLQICLEIAKRGLVDNNTAPQLEKIQSQISETLTKEWVLFPHLSFSLLSAFLLINQTSNLTQTWVRSPYSTGGRGYDGGKGRGKETATIKTLSCFVFFCENWMLKWVRLGCWV